MAQIVWRKGRVSRTKSTTRSLGRCLMDDEFGNENYLATVVWQRTIAKSLARRTMGTMHESIIVYGASEKAELQTLYKTLDDDKVAHKFTHYDERGRYHSDN